MAVRSKRITLYDPAKLSQVNSENLRLLEKYKVDMAVRDLAASTQEQYIQSLRQWFIWILDNQATALCWKWTTMISRHSCTSARARAITLRE